MTTRPSFSPVFNLQNVLTRPPQLVYSLITLQPHMVQPPHTRAKMAMRQRMEIQHWHVTRGPGLEHR